VDRSICKVFFGIVKGLCWFFFVPFVAPLFVLFVVKVLEGNGNAKRIVNNVGVGRGGERAGL
jgi:hypothetical protein